MDCAFIENLENELKGSAGLYVNKKKLKMLLSMARMAHGAFDLLARNQFKLDDCDEPECDCDQKPAHHWLERFRNLHR